VINLGDISIEYFQGSTSIWVCFRRH